MCPRILQRNECVGKRTDSQYILYFVLLFHSALSFHLGLCSRRLHASTLEQHALKDVTPSPLLGNDGSRYNSSLVVHHLSRDCWRPTTSVYRSCLHRSYTASECLVSLAAGQADVAHCLGTVVRWATFPANDQHIPHPKLCTISYTISMGPWGQRT